MTGVYAKWKGDAMVPPARALLATDLGGAEVKCEKHIVTLIDS